MPKKPKKTRPVPNVLLRQAREARGWRQSDLAEMLQVGETTIRSWESGRNATSPPLAARLCHIFGLPPEQLGLPVPPVLTPPSFEGSVEAQASSEVLPHQGELPVVLPTSLVPSPPMGDVIHIRSALFYRKVDRNRRVLLTRVRRTWIDGVLRRSLAQAALITPDLRECPQALANPWIRLVQETNKPTAPLQLGTTLVQIYDSTDGDVLLLGKPGVGKSTLFLDLTRELLIRAEQNEEASMPVVFNLASWSVKQTSLAAWLVEELGTNYFVPKKVGQVWVDTGRLIVLLDGLDEVSEEARPACVKAIDTHKIEYPNVPLVVCCRKEAYFAQPTRMSMSQAVMVEPLTEEQIDCYLDCAGGQQEVRQALLEDPELQEMSKNIFMLSIIVELANQGTNAAFALTGSIEARYQQLFELYVERALLRRGAETRYTPEQTRHWLTCLATQMKGQSQTELYLERLQPTWLVSDEVRQRYQRTVTRLIYGLRGFIVAAFFALLRGGKTGNVLGVGGGLLGWLGAGPGNAVLGWMGPGLGGGLGGGASLGIIIGLVLLLVTVLIGSPLPTLSLRSALWGVLKGARTGLIAGGIVGVFAFVLYILIGGPASGQPFGIWVGDGLFCGLLCFLEAGLMMGLRPKGARGGKNAQNTLSQMPSESKQSRRAFDSFVDFVFVSWCAGLGYGGIYALLMGSVNLTVVTYATIIALLFGLIYSLEGEPKLLRAGGDQITPVERITWSWEAAWQDTGAILGQGAIVGLLVAASVIVILGCASALFYGFSYGFWYSLVYGPIIGLVGAAAWVLTGVLNNGWSNSILDEKQLAEDQLARPNEGTHRSLRHAVFAASLFGPLGGLVSGLASALAFGLIGQLPGWPTLAIGFAIVFGGIFAFQFLLMYGGIAWLEHYLLRWYLWRAGELPARCAPFFDYATERILMRKVGGGYMFWHALLRDYFASLSATGRGETNAESSHELLVAAGAENQQQRE